MVDGKAEKMREQGKSREPEHDHWKLKVRKVVNILADREGGSWFCAAERRDVSGGTGKCY